MSSSPKESPLDKMAIYVDLFSKEFVQIFSF